MSVSLTGTIKAHPCARGLAIVITNDHTTLQSQGDKLTPILGTKKDGENMSQAFQKIGFAVHWEVNINLCKFQQLMCEAKHFTGYSKLKNYKCIAFVFSGHGKSGDYIYMQDRQLVCIGKDIIEPFLPENCSGMGKFPKLFLFDACRGEKNMRAVLVPRGQDAKGQRVDYEFRGGNKLEMKQVPPGGNFLVAYSTMPNYRSWEHPQEGGAWLKKLAEKIQTSQSSIDDVLTEVNQELVEREGGEPMQQPEKRSRLNKILYLHPSKDEPGEVRVPKRNKPLIAAVFPNSDPSQSSTTEPIQPTANPEFVPSNVDSTHSLPATHTPETGVSEQTTAELGYAETLTSQYSNVEFREYSYFPEEHRAHYYRSTVHVRVTPHKTFVGDSKEYFISVHHSRNHAAEDVLKQLESTPTNVPGYTHKEQMQIFFQRNKITPQFEWQSDNTLGTSSYRCSVQYTFNGKKETVDSEHYFPNKPDAKEHVAKKVLTSVGLFGQCNSGATSKGTSPPTKVYKSKLKEYFEKKKLAVEIRYTTVPSGNRFISTVNLQGEGIQGEVCKSKQEAEQSAAHQALEYYGGC